MNCSWDTLYVLFCNFPWLYNYFKIKRKEKKSTCIQFYNTPLARTHRNKSMYLQRLRATPYRGGSRRSGKDKRKRTAAFLEGPDADHGDVCCKLR